MWLSLGLSLLSKNQSRLQEELLKAGGKARHQQKMPSLSRLQAALAAVYIPRSENQLSLTQKQHPPHPCLTHLNRVTACGWPRVTAVGTPACPQTHQHQSILKVNKETTYSNANLIIKMDTGIIIIARNRGLEASF